MWTFYIKHTKVKKIAKGQKKKWRPGCLVFARSIFAMWNFQHMSFYVETLHQFNTFFGRVCVFNG